VRRVTRTIAIVSVLAAVMTAGSAGPAAADPIGGGTGDTRWIRVDAPGSGGGSGGAPGCDWRRYAGEIDSSYANKFDLPSYQAAKNPDGTAKPGNFYWVECGGSTELLYVPDSEPVVDPLLMAEYAANFIKGVKPTINVNPARALVKLPTWYWIDGGAGPIVATASVINETAVVTATPVSVEWMTADGPLTCPVPGTAYDSAKYAPSAKSPDCGNTYDRAGKGLSVTATINYRVTWTASGAVNTGGTLAPLSGPVSQVSLDVLEVQSIN